jgi:hypothetical protein
MHIVARFLRELLARPSIDIASEDDPIAHALWNAAVVGYGRCFTTGRRKGQAGQVEVPKELRATHDWLLDLRDKYVAHLDRGSLLEQSRAVVNLAAEGPRRVTNAVCEFRSAAHPDRSTIERSLGLAEAMATRLWASARGAGQLLYDRAAALPIDDLYAASAAGKVRRIDR